MAKLTSRKNLHIRHGKEVCELKAGGTHEVPDALLENWYVKTHIASGDISVLPKEKAAEASTKVADVCMKIAECQTIEEVEALSKGDDRKTVQSAAATKIAELKG